MQSRGQHANETLASLGVAKLGSVNTMALLREDLAVFGSLGIFKCAAKTSTAAPASVHGKVALGAHDLGGLAAIPSLLWGVLKGKATLRVPPPVPSTLLSPPFSLPSPLAGQGPGSGG